jgi:hypothetical protein
MRKQLVDKGKEIILKREIKCQISNSNIKVVDLVDFVLKKELNTVTELLI